MLYEQFQNNIRTLLKQELPGREAQFRMAPEIRKKISYDNNILSNTPKDSSVLILIYPFENDLYTVFTHRHEYQGVHSNQVSLPGGKPEPADKDLYMTALRETEEETGVEASLISFAGKLTPLYVPPSNFIIHPFVGFISEKPEFRPDSKEVKKLISVSFSEILNDNNIQTKEIRLSNNQIYPTPCYFWQNHIIWGATAMIMSEFIEILKIAYKPFYSEKKLFN